MQIEEIAKKLRQYVSRTKNPVTPASISVYIAQFPSELQSVALAWLQHLIVVNPDDEIRKLLKTCMPKISENGARIGVSPLGGIADSAATMAYKFREISAEFPTGFVVETQAPLSEMLEKKIMDTYVIYDDNTNSGMQALNIIAAWLGKELPEKYRLNEEHVNELKTPEKEELLTKNVFLLFSVAPEGATEKLKDLLVCHCGFDTNKLFLQASMTLPDKEKIFTGCDSPFQHNEKIELRKFIEDKAVKCFHAEGKNVDESTKRALGSSGAEAMIVFPYNCPTMTISAIWLKNEKEDWEPLAERARRVTANGTFAGEDA
jgi:hypothetical protein